MTIVVPSDSEGKGGGEESEWDGIDDFSPSRAERTHPPYPALDTPLNPNPKLPDSPLRMSLRTRRGTRPQTPNPKPGVYRVESLALEILQFMGRRTDVRTVSDFHVKEGSYGTRKY